MNAIYNEIEPFACDWLEALIAGGHIAAGRVERTPIQDLTASTVGGHGQRHFFAGIAGWSAAARLAGVPDDADIWTGSCPCQPFSDAGTRSGTRDARHLWPAWFELAPLRMEVIDVEIDGVTDLLQHKWDEKNLKEIRDKGEGKVSQTKAHREFRKPEEEYNGARYIDQKGRDCLPAVQFKKAMAAVAAEKALSGASKASIFRWITVTSLERQQRDLIPIEHDAKKPMMREDMVRVGPFGKRVAMLRYRPSYSNWSCKIRIEFNASVISAEMLCNLLNWAGRGIGIGEWRPEKSGEFGKFCVKRTLNSSKARGN